MTTYENKFADLQSRVILLTWMVGTNVVLSLGILGKLLGVPAHG